MTIVINFYSPVRNLTGIVLLFSISASGVKLLGEELILFSFGEKIAFKKKLLFDTYLPRLPK